jgi:hypothetical protein
VADVTAAGYLAEGIESLPENTFDLAISNLVSQHMLDWDLHKQMYYVIRSLKYSGLFAMQFAFNWDQGTDTANHMVMAAKGGSVQRSLSKIAELAAMSEGLVKRAEIIANHPEHRAGWYAVHIQKAVPPPGKNSRTEFIPDNTVPTLPQLSREVLAELDTLRKELNALKTSRSMRLTKPLRWLAHRARQMAGSP